MMSVSNSTRSTNPISSSGSAGPNKDRQGPLLDEAADEETLATEDTAPDPEILGLTGFAARVFQHLRALACRAKGRDPSRAPDPNGETQDGDYQTAFMDFSDEDDERPGRG